VAERARHRCEYCGAPEAIFNFPLEVEHVIPPGQGGSQADDNLALACRSCNLHKSDYLDGPDGSTQAVVRLYHPRRDEWRAHFSVETTGVIVGMTPAGRATVQRLRMNSPLQLAARQQWMRLGLFP
jgi:5-methylcytosine-specific restriction endonuclease McrA